MIAMQYSLVLPSDYDMGIIDRRIADRGHLTDGFAGLAFKAYLHARKQGVPSASDNVYAPFYLWHSTEGLNEFLCGPGFRGLTQSFGWPSVQIWAVWHALISQDVAQARYATREIVMIAPHADLALLRHVETEGSIQRSSRQDVLATVTAFDPTNWRLTRFQLWRDMPGDSFDGQTQVYGVGHVSTGCATPILSAM